jgi:uncharacterized protein
MLLRLPEYIDPLYLADKRAVLKGQIPLSHLDRLADMLHDDAGFLDVELFFEREGPLPKIEGHLEGALELKCQNCLAALSWPVDSKIKLGVVLTLSQADRLPEEYDALWIESETIPLKTIVEDELLLALPAFPKHAHACFNQGQNVNKADSLVNDEPSSPTKNPFSILANLKNIGDL